ncbi:hypothetical protein PWG14_25350 [Chromobacterium amazonense]|nr:hypothetical protein [Chromobacterium amazonense]MDE1715798.1 hypothetical protein [Chromobacterium amazonense]
MATCYIPESELSDSRARELRATGWLIKSPLFVNGRAVFPARKPLP